MPPKPHRVLIDRVSGYASEAAAYMRRRRVNRRPFARVIGNDGRGFDHRPGTPQGDALQAAGARLIEALENNKKH